MLEHKQFKNKAFTGSNSYWCLCKFVENNLDEQTVVFIVAVNQDRNKKGSSRVLQSFFRQKFSFVTKLMAMIL